MALISDTRAMSVRGLLGILAIAIAVSGPASLAYFSANGQAIAHENLRAISAAELPGLRRLGLPGVDISKADVACSMRLLSDPPMFCVDDDLQGRVSYFMPLSAPTFVQDPHEGIVK